METQDSMTPSEDCASEEEEDYYDHDYYGEDDADVDGECRLKARQLGSSYVTVSKPYGEQVIPRSRTRIVTCLGGY